MGKNSIVVVQVQEVPGASIDANKDIRGEINEDMCKDLDS